MDKEIRVNYIRRILVKTLATPSNAQFYNLCILCIT